MKRKFPDKIQKDYLRQMRLGDQWQLLNDLQSLLKEQVDGDRIVDTYPSLVDRAQKYATRLHRYAGQKYDDMPYKVHLQMVVDNVKAYLPKDWKKDALQKRSLIAAAWCHDVLEDCDITYNDLKKVVGTTVSDLVYRLTNELGKDRTQRAERTHDKLAASSKAVFVKCCDRLANTEYSRKAGSGMFNKYKSEYPDFRKSLGEDTGHLKVFRRLWEALDEANDYTPPGTFDFGSRMHDGRTRLATFAPQMVYDLLEDGVAEMTVGDLMKLCDRPTHDRFDPGKTVPLERLLLYKEKGATCVVSGLEGDYVALERDLGGRYHLDMYASAPDGVEDVMITRDHIMPKARGGSDDISNLQPMAKGLNENKGDVLTPRALYVPGYDWYSILFVTPLGAKVRVARGLHDVLPEWELKALVGMVSDGSMPDVNKDRIDGVAQALIDAGVDQVTIKPQPTPGAINHKAEYGNI